MLSHNITADDTKSHHTNLYCSFPSASLARTYVPSVSAGFTSTGHTLTATTTNSAIALISHHSPTWQHLLVLHQHPHARYANVVKTQVPRFRVVVANLGEHTTHRNDKQLLLQEMVDVS